MFHRQDTDAANFGVQDTAENDGVLLHFQIKYKENPVTIKVDS